MDLLNVLSLNIWNRQGPWEKRLPMIRRGLEALSPDVVGLQEVISHEGKTQAQTIAEGLGYETAFGPALDLGEQVLFGNAVLSRWPIAHHEVLSLPTRKGEEPRSLLFAEIESPWGKLPVFCTHLNWMFHHGIVREKQVVKIAEHVLDKAPVTGLCPILLGDMNAEPDSTEMRFLRGLSSLEGQSTYFADTFGLVGRGPGFTFDPDCNPYAKLTREAPRRIDHIFVRGPDHRGRGKTKRSAVVLDEVVDGVAASDHYGVLSTIQMSVPAK